MNLYGNDRYEAPCTCKSGLKRGTVAGHDEHCEYRKQEERRRYGNFAVPVPGSGKDCAR